MPPDIRWLIYRDAAHLLRIEQLSFSLSPWGEPELLAALRDRRNVGLVVEDERGLPIGYMIHALHHNHVRLVRLAVAPAHRRRGIASLLLTRLAGKLKPPRNRLTVMVPESCLGMCLLLKHLGWTALELVRDGIGHGDGCEDAVSFELRARRPAVKLSFHDDHFSGI